MNRDYRPKSEGNLFVNDNPTLKIDALYINKLKELKKEEKLKVCLHNDIRENVHEMLNFITKDVYIRPHFHPKKVETKIIIEGKLLIVTFDEIGNMKDKFILSKDGNNAFLFRMGKGIVHTVIPVTDVAYYEVTTGPYTGEEDTVFPEWSPEVNEAENISRLYDKIGYRNVQYRCC